MPEQDPVDVNQSTDDNMRHPAIQQVLGAAPLAAPRTSRGSEVVAVDSSSLPAVARCRRVIIAFVTTGVLVTFVLTAAVLAVTPGPDSLLVLRAIVLRGRRAGLATVAGVLSGLAIWVVAAAIGLSALLRASELGYQVLKVVGATYLVLLGVKALRSRGGAAEGQHDHGLLGSGYRAGLVTNLLNPKIGVFFVSFLPGFVPVAAPVALTSLLLGGLFIAEGALYFAVLLLVADRLAALLHRPTVRQRLDRITGVVLIGFGVRLVVEN